LAKGHDVAEFATSLVGKAFCASSDINRSPIYILPRVLNFVPGLGPKVGIARRDHAPKKNYAEEYLMYPLSHGFFSKEIRSQNGVLSIIS
jgi:hypothetical protein